MQNNTSRWCIFDNTRAGQCTKIRFFCFHYAGSGGSIFQPWIQFLPKEVELVAIQLPGRENRFHEALLYQMEHVTTPLAEALTPLLNKPFVFFGHSTGAMISYELARVLRKRFLKQPQLMIISGQNAPQWRPKELRHRLPDQEFIEVLRKCNGIPETILQNSTVLEFLLPRLRADGAIYETYVYEEQAPLDCRIIVYSGEQDTLVDSIGLLSWKNQTRHSFQHYSFPGDHFFIHQSEDRVLQNINAELKQLLHRINHYKEPFINDREYV